MIGSFLAGSNVTGIRSPVMSICKLLYQSGAYAFFDYAGVGAYAKVDIRGNDADDSSSMDNRLLLPKLIVGYGSPGLLFARNEHFHKGWHLLLKEAQLTLFQGGIRNTRDISSIAKTLVRLAFFKL